MIGARPITREQVKALIAKTTNVRDYALLAIGFNTGYRISELLSLKVSDVATNGVIHSTVTVKASNTKTKRGRTVSLNSTAIKAIKALVKGLDASDYLFKSRKGSNSPINRQRAHSILKALFDACLIFGNVSTHTMRKTFAKAVYEASGRKIEIVQRALGHASISSTISYLSFDDDVIDAIIQNL